MHVENDESNISGKTTHTQAQPESKIDIFFCHTWQLKKMFCHKNCLPAMKLDLTLFSINIHTFCL